MKKLTFLKMFVLATILLVGSVNVLGQTTILSNACSEATAGWTFNNKVTTSAIQQTAGGGYWLLQAANAGTKDIIISDNIDVAAYTNLILTFKLATYGSGTNNPVKVEYSIDGGTSWSETTFTSATPESSTYISSGNISLGTLATSTLKLKFTNAGIADKGVRMQNILLVGTDPTAPPTITLAPVTLTGFTYVLGSGPSAEKTFTVRGTNLTGDINLTAPANYELSKTTGVDFGATLTLTHTAGVLAETTVYTRLKSDLAVGNYNSEEISATSETATSKTVVCSGSVTAPPAPPVPVAPVATAATSVGETGFTANWEVVTGATGYKLDLYKTGKKLLSEDFSSITDGNSTISTGSNSAWDGNENFPTVNTAYKAGGAVKLGKSTGVGYITSKELDLSLGAVLTFDVKGWSEVEGTILVTVDGANSQTVTYTALMSGEFESKSVSLAAATATSKVTLTTSAKRAFIDNVVIAQKEEVFTDFTMGDVTTYAIIGLATGTTYNYVVRATNAEGASANSNIISVTTTGTPSALDQVTSEFSIYSNNGFIHGAENARIYTILGMDVTEQNGSLKGIYVVKINGKSQKIAVK